MRKFGYKWGFSHESAPWLVLLRPDVLPFVVWRELESFISAACFHYNSWTSLSSEHEGCISPISLPFWLENFGEISSLPKSSIQNFAIKLVEKRTIWPYSLAHTFFKNNTFLFVKVDSWKFQHLFDLVFIETSFRQLLFPFFLWVVWMSWNFVRFHENIFHQ